MDATTASEWLVVPACPCPSASLSLSPCAAQVGAQDAEADSRVLGRAASLEIEVLGQMGQGPSASHGLDAVSQSAPITTIPDRKHRKKGLGSFQDSEEVVNLRSLASQVLGSWESSYPGIASPSEVDAGGKRPPPAIRAPHLEDCEAVLKMQRYCNAVLPQHAVQTCRFPGLTIPVE